MLSFIFAAALEWNESLDMGLCGIKLQKTTLTFAAADVVQIYLRKWGEILQEPLMIAGGSKVLVTLPQLKSGVIKLSLHFLWS